MRVISGTARGRRLASFRGDKIRPTADKVKGSIFNIIVSNFGPLENMEVLDLFSGTGNLGIEALSRGAAKAVFVDEHPASGGDRLADLKTPSIGLGGGGSSDLWGRRRFVYPARVVGGRQA